jgi:hypothetical protein
VGAAAAAIRRVLDVTSLPNERALMLPAYVEIMLAAGDAGAARAACAERAEIAAGHGARCSRPSRRRRAQPSRSRRASRRPPSSCCATRCASGRRSTPPTRPP